MTIAFVSQFTYLCKKRKVKHLIPAPYSCTGYKRVWSLLCGDGPLNMKVTPFASKHGSWGGHPARPSLQESHAPGNLYHFPPLGACPGAISEEPVSVSSRDILSAHKAL